MEAAQTHSVELGAAPACRAFGVPRASFYRHWQRRAEPAPDPIRRRSHRSLSEVERQEVLDLLHGDRFVDQAPAQVAAAPAGRGPLSVFPTNDVSDPGSESGSSRTKEPATPSRLYQAGAVGYGSESSLELGHHEVEGTPGQILALGIREGGKDGSEKKRGPLSDELSQLRGGLATFIAAESGVGGEQGASVFQPRPWNFTRLGASPPDALIQLNEQVHQMMASALGIPNSLLVGGAQTGLRESLRVFISTTLAPTAARFRHEARMKLQLDDEWSFPNLVASDIATRARAYSQLVGAKMKDEDARRLAGLED